MATTTNRQQFLMQMTNALKKHFKAAEAGEKMPVLEHVIYAICRRDTTREKADPAFRRLQEKFFDWNEVRVSSPSEVAEAMGDVPDAEPRAERVVGLLQQVFEELFSFDLDAELHKKGLKVAARQLDLFEQVDDFALAWVIQHALGGHAVPLDGPMVRVLTRLAVLDDPTADIKELRGSVEHMVPKARGVEFAELMTELAHTLCHDDAPDCANCPLRKECPTGQDLAPTKARPKPR